MSRGFDSPEIQAAISKAEDALLKKQNKDGSWIGEVELNPGPTAQIVMLFEAIGQKLDESKRLGAVAYILRTQNKDGGWSPHGGAPSEVSLTLECYLALRIAGSKPDDEVLVKARKKIFELGE